MTHSPAHFAARGPAPDLAPIRRALLSVSDKSGVIEFARGLAHAGVVLVSTGGTARALRDAGLDVTPVESLTNFPEMMDGRVKTLHPGVHGGILALRNDDTHLAAMRTHAIEPIDLVCVNLYPFERAVQGPGCTRDDAIENIDVGGPAMIRAAAKNHAFVTVVTDPAQYATVLTELGRHEGRTSRALRAELARAAFARTSAYDAAIATYLAQSAADPSREERPPADEGPFPETLSLTLKRVLSPRYGENPHQRAAVYADPAFEGPSVLLARQLHGKDLSYNNLADAAAALAVAIDLARFDPSRISASVVKHTNPCGASVAPTARLAVDAAIAGDPVAAYGGILALGGPMDADAAERLCRDDVFLEVALASSFEPAALELLRSRWKNLRVLEVGPINAAQSSRTAAAAGARVDRTRLSLRSIPGAILAQELDDLPPSPGAWTLAAGPEPGPERRRDAALSEIVAKHLSSNAVAICGADPDRPGVFRLFGAGAGQMDRVASCRIAVQKAGTRAQGAIAASDAFFPFSDGPTVLLEAGVTLLVHPGSSKRDEDTFRVAGDRAASVLVTGIRHFRH